MTSPGLRAARTSLLDDRGLTGSEWCRRYSEAADEWLRSLLADATDGDEKGIALLAVGGYGRGELAPGSDLDLLLVYDRRGRIAPIADGIWYPIWDAGLSLDHSVRTAREVRTAMDADIRVALGLLDARQIAGDEKLGRQVLSRSIDLWRTRAGRWLPTLDESTRVRHTRFGDLAFLLEPDLKEARGGLRDLNLLRSLGKVVPIFASTFDDPALVSAGEVLTAARVELQRSSGKSTNELLLQEQDGIASDLHYSDADALMADVADAARAIAWANDDGWRRIESWLAGPRGRGGGTDHPLEPGLVLRDDEVTLTAGASVPADPSLPLRAAAVSAELDKPMARNTLDRLGAEATPPAGTWPPEVLEAFVRLLGAGRPAIAAIESLDQIGVWLRYLPEWAPVRNRPQRNAYHRFTIDRHLLETAANAAEFTRSVGRPDLLLLGALFHDIGKGREGDHTEQGMALVCNLCPRLGLAERDTETVEAMVRYHLLLPDVATRRDIEDPATASLVANAVEDMPTLELLAALTEADSLATGPSAWGPWKAALVARLVEVTAAQLEGAPAPPPQAAGFGARQLELLQPGELKVLVDGGQVEVIAPDRCGLLAVVSGVLTLSGLNVRRASTYSQPETGMALLRFDVAPGFDRPPDWDKVRARIDAALDGRLPLESSLEERERHYSRYRRASTAVAPSVRVTTDNDGSASSTIVEVRAPDRGPVLYKVARALAEVEVTITRALVSTLGAEAIDVFYVQTLEGAQVRDPARLERLQEAVLQALG